MALSRPTAPELARFTFFVSRRREEGRERFRLHMGYFQTRDEAEQLLALIRDLYPAAWVGEAPGQRLAARQAAEAAATAKPATAAATPPAAKPSSPPATKPSAAPATAVERKPPAPTRASAPANKPVAPAAAKPAPAPAPKPAAPAAPRPAVPAAAKPAAAEPAAAARAVRAPTSKGPPSNVREVIASLDSQSPAPIAPAPVSPPVAEPRARRAVAPRPEPAGPAAPAPPPRADRSADELSDSQVLRILETRRASATGQPAAGTRTSSSDIRMLNPDDTQTWRDIRSQISRDAAVHFAVQLAWSVTPIDLEKIPGLAIFNSYTLYKIEGNREGRRWYGLRLGFFSDAVAARQVALYVRSEFSSVAVVPVSAKERGDATQVGAIELPRPALAASSRRAEDEFELIDDAVDAALGARDGEAAEPASQATSDHGTASAAQPATAPVAPAGAARRPNRPRGSPQTLEETLEILGASQLSIDDGKGVRLDLGSSTGGRGGGRAGPRNTTFSKLLERLTEKLRN